MRRLRAFLLLLCFLAPAAAAPDAREVVGSEGIETADFSLGSAFTMSVWVSPFNANAGRFFYQYAGTGPILNGDWLLQRLGPTGTPVWQIGTSAGGHTFSGSTDLTQDVWQLVTGTWDGTNAELYVDCVDVGGGTTTGTRSDATTLPVRIGLAGTLGTDGDVAHAAIWTRVLSADEVTTLCRCWPDSLPDSLELHWPMVETSGTVHDWSGNGRHGAETENPTARVPGPPISRCTSAGAQ